MNTVIAQQFTTAQIGKFERDRNPDHNPASLFDERNRRAGGPTGCQHVIHDEDTRTRFEPLRVNFEGRLAVFELETFVQEHTRKFAGLANGNHPDACGTSGCGSENESTRRKTMPGCGKSTWDVIRD